MRKTFISVLCIAIYAIIMYAVGYYGGVRKNEKVVEQLVMQQAKYEILLDSTEAYIFRKYDEFLSDTYWESELYWSLYEGSDSYYSVMDILKKRSYGNK